MLQLKEISKVQTCEYELVKGLIKELSRAESLHYDIATIVEVINHSKEGNYDIKRKQ